MKKSYEEKRAETDSQLAELNAKNEELENHL